MIESATEYSRLFYINLIYNNAFNSQLNESALSLFILKNKKETTAVGYVDVRVVFSKGFFLSLRVLRICVSGSVYSVVVIILAIFLFLYFFFVVVFLSSINAYFFHVFSVTKITRNSLYPLPKLV